MKKVTRKTSNEPKFGEDAERKNREQDQTTVAGSKRGEARRLWETRMTRRKIGQDTRHRRRNRKRESEEEEGKGGERMKRKERNSQNEGGCGGVGWRMVSVCGGGLGEFVPAVEVSTAGDQSDAKMQYVRRVECNVYLE